METRILPSGVLEFYESRAMRIGLAVVGAMGTGMAAFVWLMVKGRVGHGSVMLVGVFILVLLAFGVSHIKDAVKGKRFSFDGAAGAVFMDGKRIRDFGRLEHVDVAEMGSGYKLSIVFQSGRTMEVETLPSYGEIFKKADAIGETMGVPVTWWRSKGHEGQG